MPIKLPNDTDNQCLGNSHITKNEEGCIDQVEIKGNDGLITMCEYYNYSTVFGQAQKWVKKKRLWVLKEQYMDTSWRQYFSSQWSVRKLGFNWKEDSSTGPPT